MLKAVFPGWCHDEGNTRSGQQNQNSILRILLRGMYFTTKLDSEMVYGSVAECRHEVQKVPK
jgi:hypothetical protein